MAKLDINGRAVDVDVEAIRRCSTCCATISR